MSDEIPKAIQQSTDKVVSALQGYPAVLGLMLINLIFVIMIAVGIWKSTDVRHKELMQVLDICRGQLFFNPGMQRDGAPDEAR